MAWQCSVCDKIVEQGVRKCPNGCDPLKGLEWIIETLKEAGDGKNPVR